MAAREDKMVQPAIVTILHALYEEDFRAFRMGFDRDAARIQRWTRSRWRSPGST